jgi:hypothetical protein
MLACTWKRLAAVQALAGVAHLRLVGALHETVDVVV